MISNKKKVTICGGGNLAHFSAAVIGANPNFTVNVFTRRPKDWAKTVVATPIQGSPWQSRGVFRGNIELATDDPKLACKNTNIFIICGPAHIHPILLEQIAPYVEKNTFVGTCYAQGGFDMAANFIFGKKIRENNITIYGLQTVPSITQISEYGKTCRIIGPKKLLLAASIPSDRKYHVCQMLEQMYNIPTVPLPNFLNLTLTPSNQIIHPACVYGVFRDWDGTTPFKEGTLPLLYEDLDDFSADMMQVLDDEIQNIKKAILLNFPHIDLSYIIPLKQRIINQYGDQVKDTSTLKRVFNTNLGYSTIKIPVIKVEGGVVLNTMGRFFYEDIPYGLCILKDIARIVNVKTPGFDKMIEFHQRFMPGKQFLVNDQLNKDLINETGTPTRYGIQTIEQLLQIQNFQSKL